MIEDKHRHRDNISDAAAAAAMADASELLLNGQIRQTMRPFAAELIAFGIVEDLDAIKPAIISALKDKAPTIANITRTRPFSLTIATKIDIDHVLIQSGCTQSEYDTENIEEIATGILLEEICIAWEKAA